MAMSAALLTMAADSADARRRSSLSALPGLARPKQIVDVKLSNPQSNCFVPSFTTLERIEGVATVTCPSDTTFDSVHVTFQGNVKVYVEKLATSAPTNPKRSAFHTFLRLLQPLNDEQLPEDNIFKAGVTYNFPFTFVVPDRLLPQACAHPTQNSTVHEEHLNLPPTLGDPMMAGDGKSLLDDMTPDNVRVCYGIRVFALRKAKGQSRPKMLFDSIKKIKIIPAVPEAPPIQVADDSPDDYILSNSKTIKKGVFKGKSGSVTVEAVQPAPFFLHSPSSSEQCQPSALATVHARFEPTELNSKPPKLGSLICRLKVATFYGAIPLETMPTRSHAYQFDSNRGVYVDTIPLSTRCIGGVQWTRNEASARRDSVMSKTQSTSSMSDTAQAGKDKKHKKDRQDPATLPFYTASILLPLSLPPTRSFVPTFHSCLLSRIYLLDIVLSVHPGTTSDSSITVSTTNFHLKVPIQVAAHGNADARPVISEEEAASIARREADDYFEPRTIRPAEPGSREQTPPIDPSRGARGSIFTARWGSVDGMDSGGETSGEGPLPPRYTGHVRSGMVMG
ncbi:hypothetical protein MMC10_006667 [Thelotrema lepadinum]|nr:hypothetical protein [Thelotrema lepadinum]